MGRIGAGEIIFIAVVFVLLFGVKKLPEMGRSLGEAIREFKKAGKELENEVKGAAKESDAK
ncbi:MAG: twin-arginine translocase TatA/TatE family subunit [Candidatus Omnitrophica bacterium]|nr:twin-arginine translocase TatA/TatE family subunit [Candidatus Omnitrophota bacterium]